MYHKLPASKDEIVPMLHRTNLFNSVLPEVESTIQHFFNDFFRDRNRVFDVFKNQSQYPKTDVIESNEGLIFQMAVPGLNREDIEILFEDNVLTVRQNQTMNREAKDGEKVIYKELRKSAFSRSFKLNEQVNTEGISAKLNNGILDINLPYLVPIEQPNQTKKIEIE